MPGDPGETGEITPVTAQYSALERPLAASAGTKLAFCTDAPVVGKPIALAGMRKPDRAAQACSALAESASAKTAGETDAKAHPRTRSAELCLKTTILTTPHAQI